MYGNPLDVTCDEAAVKHLFMRLDCFAQCPAYDLLDMGADTRATEPASDFWGMSVYATYSDFLVGGRIFGQSGDVEDQRRDLKWQTSEAD
jgi:hypothetical protein